MAVTHEQLWSELVALKTRFEEHHAIEFAAREQRQTDRQRIADQLAAGNTKFALINQTLEGIEKTLQAMQVTQAKLIAEDNKREGAKSVWETITRNPFVAWLGKFFTWIATAFIAAWAYISNLGVKHP